MRKKKRGANKRFVKPFSQLCHKSIPPFNDRPHLNPLPEGEEDAKRQVRVRFDAAGLVNLEIFPDLESRLGREYL